VKAGGKESNRLAKIYDYIGKRREMEDSNSVTYSSLQKRSGETAQLVVTNKGMND
jgi:hypothetical protein